MMRMALVAGAVALIVLCPTSPSTSNAAGVGRATSHIGAHASLVANADTRTTAESPGTEDEPESASQSTAPSIRRDEANLSAARALASLLMLEGDGGRWRLH